MNKPIPEKPLLVSILQFVLYIIIIRRILEIVLQLIYLFGSAPSTDGVLSFTLSVLVSGLLIACSWLLDLMVKARLRIGRIALAVLVVVICGFWIYGSGDGGPMYQERVQNWQSGSSYVNPFSPAYAAGKMTSMVVKGLLGVIMILNLLYGQKSKNYFTNSLSEREHSKPHIWEFELLWMVASTVGFFVGQVVRLAVSYVLSFAMGLFDALLGRPPATGLPPALMFVGWAVTGVVIGAVIGTTQWLVLRRRIHQAGWWVLASVVGVSLGFLTLAVIKTIGGAVVGAVTGTIQWFVLRRRVSRAGWWVLASTVGWAGSWAFGGSVLDGTAFGTVYGLITGIALVWLLRHCAPEIPSLG